MSEQDKRAEMLWREAWIAWEAVWDQENEDVFSDEAAIAVISAALAQVRREGKKEMYSVLAECIRGLRRMRRGTKTELLKLLDALYARLLPKEEAGER